ncbi:lambda family phage tail tape measure protein [Stenotrophomonas rhizophila]|uniref:Lambda family phage tail tape measure protein n=1 Tax=Stenotrophomonas rhizophila TaxID=216778 RepID=A0A498CEI6_9GAMM|nr:phage tail tape measure protein [Stenotrophomonas rhizophila]RLK53457.1 lambda family phage tail tape measure protein [Stenotrophomonas rhizophila]
MADIAELGYKVDSSGLVEGTKALDDNAAAAEKTGNAAARLEKEYQSMSRTVDQSSKALGDRLGGALDRIGVGTGSVIAELQTLNRTQSEVLAALGGLDTRLTGTASALKAYEAAGQQAAAAVTSTATASQRLETDLAAQEARYRSVAREAVAYAESTRGANLSDRALAEAAREATSAYDSRAAVTARMGTEQERLAARAKSLQEAEARATNQAKDAARATQAQELNLKKLLGQIDPTVAGLNRLADMEDRLAKARDLGLIKPQVFQQYQAQLEATRAKTLAAAQGTGTLSGQLGQLNLRSVETQQSLVSLIRSLATGDIGQAQSSITSLTARTGALSSAFTLTGLAVGGTVAAIAGVAVVAAKGYMEMRQLEGIVTATGNASGYTTDQLMHMRSELGSATGNYKDATAAISMLVSEGRASGQALELIASSAVNLSTLTGSSISSTVNEIEALATGGADALVKLNDRYNFLTPEIYRHIEAVREQRGDYAATQSALEQFDQVMNERAENMAESAGVVERAWKGALAAFRGTMEEIKSIGRNDLDSQIGRLKDDLAFFQTLQRSPIPGDATRGNAGVQEMQRRIEQLSEWKQELDDGAKILGQIAQHGKDVVVTERDMARERAAADEALKGRLAGLDREASKLLARNKIIELYNKLDVDAYDINGKKLPPDSRLLDGSMERLIARSNADIDKQFNKRDGLGKKNADDNSVQTFIANVERQITANQQLADSGDKVTASDRMVIQARQMLADKTNNMTAATRTLLQAMIPQLEASDAQAQAEVQRQRGMQASLALTERLTQLEKQRQEQADIDLMGIGRGGDATQMLQRQLDIQRQFLREQEKLDKAYNSDRLSLTAEAAVIRKAQYDQDTASLQTSLNNSLDIERNYQERRAAMLGDWRTGVNRVWADYVSAAGNASDQAGSLVSNSLSGMEDALVRLAQTGKLSFTSLANSIIADLARIAAKQAAVGLFNAVAGAWGGGSTYTGSGTGAGSIGSFGNNLMSFGGGRANGGPVRGSTLYEVGEGGKPELFNDGRGRTYLIPGNNGNVVPAAPTSTGSASAAAPTPQFNITINGATGGGTATAKPNQSGGADIEVMLDQMEGRIAGNFAQGVSPLNSALEGRYDVAARV